jgi:hypothetical protein
MMAVETISGMVRDGIADNRNAPTPEPINVRNMSIGRRCLLTTEGVMNGKVPPTLISVSANMLVATATCGLIPAWNITGTVMIDVLPVTTLTMLVAKKIAIKVSK